MLRFEHLSTISYASVSPSEPHWLHVNVHQIGVLKADVCPVLSLDMRLFTRLGARAGYDARSARRIQVHPMIPAAGHLMPCRQGCQRSIKFFYFGLNILSRKQVEIDVYDISITPKFRLPKTDFSRHSRVCIQYVLCLFAQCVHKVCINRLGAHFCSLHYWVCTVQIVCTHCMHK
jgi:hypothetical protein